MFLAKYSPSAKLFATLSIALVFVIIAWKLVPVAGFMDHSVQTTGLVIGYSDECTEIQYTDSMGNVLSSCNPDIQTQDVGADVTIWILDSVPGTVLVENPLFLLLKYSLAGFGWFGFFMACMWWYSVRLEKWARDEGLTLAVINFAPPWNNPLGKRFRIDLILKTFKVAVLDRVGQELVAWVRFKPIYLSTDNPTVLWADDAQETLPKNSPKQPETILPPGALADKLAQRKGERMAGAQKPQNELLF